MGTRRAADSLSQSGFRSCLKSVPIAVAAKVRHVWDNRELWASRAGDTIRYIGRELLRYLKLDIPLVVFIVVFLVVFAPTLGRNLDSPQGMAAYVNDEPFLTMALEATLEWPYGNPANYFDTRKAASKHIPEHWGNMRYDFIFYYGGSTFQIAFPFYAASRAAGLPAFPTGPLILRSISLLAGLASLIILYNIAKIRGWWMAGLLALIYQVTDSDFLYYLLYIHPDTLQMFFALCAFIFAVAHAKDGHLRSLFALGLFCGIVQGTKVGGPWIMPMALLALWLGYHVWQQRLSGVYEGPAWGGEVDKRKLLDRIIVLGAAALLGLFLSTPYVFLDSYYLRALMNTLGMVDADRLQQKEEITLAVWITAVATKIGMAGTILLGITCLRAVAVNFRRPSDPVLLLAIVLSLTQLLWFGILSKVWIILGYLIVSFGLLLVLSYETLLIGLHAGVRRLFRSRGGAGRWPGRALWLAGCFVIILGLIESRWYTTGRTVADLHLSKYSTVRGVNDWAIRENISPDAMILFDDLSYFDAKRFPKARMHGGVLTWPAIEILDPDYIVLSSSLYGAAWARHLRETQQMERHDPGLFNMRLYQDLLASDELGPTKVPGITLIHVIHPVLQDVLAALSARGRVAADEDLVRIVNSRLDPVIEFCIAASYWSISPCKGRFHNFMPFFLQVADIERRVRGVFGIEGSASRRP